MYCTEYAIFTYAFQVSTYTSQVWFFAMSRMKEDKFTHTLNLRFRGRSSRLLTKSARIATQLSRKIEVKPSGPVG